MDCLDDIFDKLYDYVENKNLNARNEIIIFMIPLVKEYIFYEMSDKPRFKSNLDDYLQQGYEILIKTIDECDYKDYKRLKDTLYDNLDKIFMKPKQKSI